MNEPCRFERDVLEGRWSDELRTHLATCEKCAGRGGGGAVDGALREPRGPRAHPPLMPSSAEVARRGR